MLRQLLLSALVLGAAQPEKAGESGIRLSGTPGDDAWRFTIFCKKPGRPGLLVRLLKDPRTGGEDFVLDPPRLAGTFDISPNGRCLAYETGGDNRGITIASIRDHQAAHILGTFEHVRDPRWGARGRSIVVQRNDKGQLSVGWIDLANGGMSIADKQCMSPVAVPTTGQLVCRNATGLIVLSAEGKVVKSISLKERVPDYVGRIPAQTDVSTDGRRFILEVSVRDASLPWHDGSKDDVYMWDSAMERLDRMTPPNFVARQPRWLGAGGAWLFLGFELTAKNRKTIQQGGWPVENLYLMPEGGKKRPRILETDVAQYAVSRGGLEGGTPEPARVPFDECVSGPE